jgi:hypothetical protein
MWSGGQAEEPATDEPFLDIEVASVRGDAVGTVGPAWFVFAAGSGVFEGSNEYVVTKGGNPAVQLSDVEVVS